MTVKEWLSQNESENNQPAEIVQVTGVKANPTDKGVEIILETPQSTQLQVTNRSTGNNFIANDVNNYNLTTDILGKVSTGSIKHQLLFGVDLSRSQTIGSTGFGATAPSLDLFNPVYNQPLGTLSEEPSFSSTSVSDALGVFIQDQVTLTNNPSCWLSKSTFP